MIMTLQPRPKTRSRGTAQRDGTIMIWEQGTLVYNVLLQVGHVFHCTHVSILIVGKDYEDVWLFHARVNAVLSIPNVQAGLVQSCGHLSDDACSKEQT